MLRFSIKRHGGGTESEADMEGLAAVRASCGSMRVAVRAEFGCAEEDHLRRGGDIFLLSIARNPLKSPESDEGIQTNPRESKPVSLVFLGRAWIRLGTIWLEARFFLKMRMRLAFRLPGRLLGATRGSAFRCDLP